MPFNNFFLTFSYISPQKYLFVSTLQLPPHLKVFTVSSEDLINNITHEPPLHSPLHVQNVLLQKYMYTHIKKETQTKKIGHFPATLHETSPLMSRSRPPLSALRTPHPADDSPPTSEIIEGACRRTSLHAAEREHDVCLRAVSRERVREVDGSAGEGRGTKGRTNHGEI